MVPFKPGGVIGNVKTVLPLKRLERILEKGSEI